MSISNPFADEIDQILEGFLCPMCKVDLKTPDRLTSHVEKEHSEEQDLLKSFKDIFITAKKKIRYFDENVAIAQSLDNAVKSTFTPPQKATVVNLPKVPQEVGAFCNHFDYFKTIRAPGLERYATETNKLIIRLHKLLTDRPLESDKRKQHEQMLVPWLDGSTVKLCPICAAKFNITRRQHHCRLCGSIMCHDCSRFLAIQDAFVLVNPTVLSPTEQPTVKDKDKDELRICEYCLHLLNNRKDMQASQSNRPIISVYYDKIQELKQSIVPDIPMYNNMIASLYEGDSIFTLADVSALRGKIGRVAEHIDAFSKAILNLPSPQESLEESLKKSIRLACIKYIKDEMISLDPLPLEEDIHKRQEKRKRETEQRIKMERQLAQEAREKYDVVGNGSTMVQNGKKERFASGSAVTSIDNWSGHQPNVGSVNDPLIEQINIIKGYIKQARIALRFEEVATLELNLRELEQEFYNRQNPK